MHRKSYDPCFEKQKKKSTSLCVSFSSLETRSNNDLLAREREREISKNQRVDTRFP